MDLARISGTGYQALLKSIAMLSGATTLRKLAANQRAANPIITQRIP
jgi:hypothetical protein